MDEVEVWRSHIEDIAFTNNNILADQQGFIQFKSILFIPPPFSLNIAHTVYVIKKKLYIIGKAKMCSSIFVKYLLFLPKSYFVHIFKEI